MIFFHKNMSERPPQHQKIKSYLAKIRFLHYYKNLPPQTWWITNGCLKWITDACMLKISQKNIPLAAKYFQWDTILKHNFPFFQAIHTKQNTCEKINQHSLWCVVLPANSKVGSGTAEFLLWFLQLFVSLKN